MKRLVGLIIVVSMFVIFAAYDSGSSSDEIFVSISHKVFTTFTRTNVLVKQGGSYISGADVRANGVALQEENVSGAVYYHRMVEIEGAFGDPVTVTVSIDGEEIVNETLTVPAAVSMDLLPNPFDVSIPNAIAWEGPQDCDGYEVYISSLDTSNSKDYLPWLAAMANSHTIPAGIVEDHLGDSLLIEVHAVNWVELGSLGSGSEMRVSSYDYDTATTVE